MGNGNNVLVTFLSNGFYFQPILNFLALFTESE